MSTTTLPLHFGHNGSNTISGVCGFGPFDGERYFRDDRIEHGLWIEKASMLWVLRPLEGRRKCSVCDGLNVIEERCCTECGATLWVGSFLDTSIADKVWFPREIIEHPCNLSVPDREACLRELETIRSADTSDRFQCIDKAVEYFGFRKIPRRSRMFKSEEGYYLSKKYRV